MKSKILLLAAAALLFAGCAPKAPTFSIEPTWTEKPAELTVVFTEPLVDNQDDLKDDLAEYASNFSEWFGTELKKNFTTVTRNSIKTHVKSAKSMIVEIDSVGTTKFNTPKPTSFEGNGYYFAIANASFSRKVDTYNNQAYYSSGAAYGQPVNPGTNSMAFAGSTITEQGLWFVADYAIYNAEGKRVAFGHQGIRSKFAYAMTRSDWEKCVTAFVKKSLARTPILK